MHNVALALSGAWRVLLASLVLGAGLPAVFALGVRALSLGVGGVAPAPATATGPALPMPGPRPIGRFLGGICFTVVLAGVALGIAFVVATGSGKTLSFEHVYPTIVAKH